MADPFSIATGVVSIIAVAASATQAMHRLIVSMRSAPEALLALSNELSDLAVVLVEVRTLVEKDTPLPSTSKERLAKLLHKAQPKIEDIEQLANKLNNAGGSNLLNFARYSWVEGKARAKRLQEDLRVFRLNLASILAANTASGVLRLEVALKSLAVMSQHIDVQQYDVHVDKVTQVTHYTGRLDNMLSQLGPILEKNEERLRQLRPVKITGQADEKASSDPPPAYSPMPTGNIQISAYRPQACKVACPCKCHQRRHMTSPVLLNRLMGQLFVGYSSNVLSKAECSESSCYQPSRFAMQLVYYFPTWFLARAIVAAITQGSFDSIQASLSLHKIVPQSADVFEFCAAGDVAGIHSLFRMGKASANDTYRAGGSPLLNYAIERGQVQVARFLIDVGADPLMTDGLGRSAIDFACINVFADTFGSFVTMAFRGLFLPPAILAQRQLTTLHQIVVGLLDRDLESEMPYLTHIINATTWDGRTALSWACRRGDLDAVQILLRYGADTCIYDINGNGPLHSAACSKNWRCLAALLEHNADASHNNKRNESPLNYSLFYSDDPHYLQPLLDAGANVNNRDYNGDTPLITATYRAPVASVVPAFGADNCVDYLIRRGGNTEIASHNGNTPLLNAVVHNNTGAIATLLRAKADHRARNEAGDTLLHLAARHGDPAVVRVLRDWTLTGLDIEAINNEAYTPREAIKQRAKHIDGFAELFDELLASIADEAGLDSMVASTILTVSSYEDAVEYQAMRDGHEGIHITHAASLIESL